MSELADDFDAYAWWYARTPRAAARFAVPTARARREALAAAYPGRHLLPGRRPALGADRRRRRRPVLLL